MRFAMHLAYKGTGYHGWQRQRGSITVQEVLEDKLELLFGGKTAVLGCGRTDTGVHASSFFLHFDASDELPQKLVFRLNQMLPKDIAVFEVFPVHDDFNARFDAKSRTYIYKTTLIKNAFEEDLSLFLYRQPDVELMNKACGELLKHNDFASFCKSGGNNKTTFCHLMKAEWSLQGEFLQFEVKADRFLRNMVRALVGTLLDVGYGDTSIEDLRNIIASKQRENSGKSVAARGLYLKEIEYNWDEHRQG